MSGGGGQPGHGAPSHTHLVTRVPTHTHDKSPSHTPSSSRHRSQVAPEGLHRTLPLSLSEGKESDFGWEPPTCLLSQLSLPNQKGNNDRKMRERHRAWCAAANPHGDRAVLAEPVPRHLSPKPLTRWEAHTHQQSTRETPGTVLSRMEVQGEGCSEQPPPSVPFWGTPGRRAPSSPFQPAAEPRGPPASGNSGESSESALHKQEGSCHERRSI